VCVCVWFVLRVSAMCVCVCIYPLCVCVCASVLCVCVRARGSPKYTQKPDLKDVFGANYDEQESESSSSDDSEMEIDEKAKALVSQDKRKQTTAPDSDQKTNIKVEIAKPLPLPLARYSRRARTKPTLVTHTPPALPTNAKLVLARLPKILAIETKPFVVEDFRNSADTDTHTHTRIPPMVARWRYARDSDNNLIKESNARLVKWSDGSLQLMIGKEALRVAEHPIHMQKIYLLSDVQLPPHTSKRTKLRQFYGAFASKMFFSPTTHARMHTHIHTYIHTYRYIQHTHTS